MWRSSTFLLHDHLVKHKCGYPCKVLKNGTCKFYNVNDVRHFMTLCWRPSFYFTCMTSWLIKQFEHNATRPVSEWLTKQGNDRTWVLVLDEDTQCAEASLLHSFFSPSGSFGPADGRIRKTKKLISPFCSPLPPPTLVSWPALSSQPHSLAKTSIYVKQLFSPPQPSKFRSINFCMWALMVFKVELQW